ncbi:MAG: sulfate ABC transporter permease subunit CysT [Caulobacter sp.]|nr:sulfate ABC transporter permease subunit CysT [Caulobacter sp.]
MTLANVRAGRRRQAGVLPGFRLSMAITLTWLSVIVLIPLAALAIRPWELGLDGVWRTLTDERVVAAFRLSFGAAAVAAAADAVLGLIVAWAIVRYRFPGRRLLDALVDLPFALPTAVAGIALTAIYAPDGPLGALLAHVGVKTAYSPLGVVIALTFIGLPFVVRAVQPVLEEVDREVEEAARTLGASDYQRIVRVVLPAILPAILAGVGLAFARAVGEYGSVIFIAGNLPMVSEIAPLLIVIKLEQYNYAGAAAVGLGMLVISFAILLVLNLLQTWLTRRSRG